MTDRMILCDWEKVDREGVEMIQHYKESPLVQKAMDDVEKYFTSKQEITKIEKKQLKISLCQKKMFRSQRAEKNPFFRHSESVRRK